MSTRTIRTITIGNRRFKYRLPDGHLVAYFVKGHSRAGVGIPSHWRAFKTPRPATDRALRDLIRARIQAHPGENGREISPASGSQTAGRSLLAQASPALRAKILNRELTATEAKDRLEEEAAGLPTPTQREWALIDQDATEGPRPLMATTVGDLLAQGVEVVLRPHQNGGGQ